MKINFDDLGYIEFSQSPSNTIFIIIAAPHKDNEHDTIINSAEITNKQLLELVESLGLKELKLEQLNNEQDITDTEK